MIFGPLSESDLAHVIQKLDHYKAHYLVKDSSIEIPDSLVNLVEDELIAVGALTPIQVAELDHEEFLCVKCDYISVNAGSCPTHGGALVDYSTWVASKGKSGDSNIVGIVFAVLIVIALLVAFLK